MTNQIATTKEQSQRLIACGVKSETADMTWVTVKAPNLGCKTDVLIAEPLRKYDNLPTTPAWSLSALLAMLPKEVTDENTDEYHISLAYERPLCSDYDVSYKPCWFAGEDLIAKHDTCPIEACVQMIEWLTQNGYNLNNP